MVSDYDAPRASQDDAVESLDALQIRKQSAGDEVIDVDDSDPSALELPGADLSDESLQIRLVPEQPDEFTCSRCSLVRHRSQHHHQEDMGAVCNDCAA